MKKSSPLILLTLIIFLASLLRLIALGNIPSSMNPDELALGYNSYALLTTGADEWGNHFPLALKSFGDWKLPVYPLITMLPIKLFDLTEFAVRLPSAIAGIVAVILSYGISLLLFRKKSLALITALLFALSPWGIFFSRGAFETNVALTFFLGGLYSFFFYEEKQKHIVLLFITAFLFGITLFTYHAYIIFMPLFTFGLIFLYRKNLFQKKTHIFPFLLFIFFIAVSAFSLLGGSLAKANTDTIFSNADTIYFRSKHFRTPLAGDNTTINKLLYNKYSGVGYQIVQNYFLSFSPSFLFDAGGVKEFFNMEEFGPLYAFDAVLLLMGIGTLCWKREKILPLLGLWLFISPIPSALAAAAPSQSRVMPLLPLFILVEAYGVYTIGKIILSKPNVMYKLGAIFAIALFAINFVYFLDLYYYQMDLWRARFFHYGYKQIVEVANKYPGDDVVVKGPDNFPYISFLFYNKYDPIKLRKEVQYYPLTAEGFYFVKSFGKYSFVPSINRHAAHSHTIYFDYPDEKDRDHLILYPTGDPAFAYFDNTWVEPLPNASQKK